MAAEARAAKPGHFGLPVLCERIDGAGGACAMESAPGQGTTISFWVPREVTSA